MRRRVALVGLSTLAAAGALAATAHAGDGDRGRCGKSRGHAEKGYEVILDGSRKCFALGGMRAGRL